MRTRPQGSARRRGGFTLVELVVVIGIIVLLLAIMVPIAGRLVSGQRLQGCEMNLNKLCQALKVYRMEEGGFPPYEFKNGNIRGRGLFALLDTDHLRSSSVLRCPSDDADYTDPAGSGQFPLQYGANAYGYDSKSPLSYMWVDDKATRAGSSPPMFRYLCDRQRTSGTPYTHSDYTDRVPRLRQGSSWQPDDTTVVTWCSFHARNVTEAGKGQYLVLFYDGRVEKMDADLFRTGSASSTPPEEGWRVRPGQTGWDGSGEPTP